MDLNQTRLISSFFSSFLIYLIIDTFYCFVTNAYKCHVYISRQRALPSNRT